MSHPDAAPSVYVGPFGPYEHVCSRPGNRIRIGPTSRRRNYWVLADVCNCGRVMRTVRDVSWQEYFWLRRWNARQASQQ